MNEDSMYVLAKSIKKEMEQNLRSKILKKKSQEMESALENFKQLFEKTITACQVLDKKQKISLDISKNVQKNFLSPDIKMNQHNKKIQNSKS